MEWSGVERSDCDISAVDIEKLLTSLARRKYCLVRSYIGTTEKHEALMHLRFG